MDHTGTSNCSFEHKAFLLDEAFTRRFITTRFVYPTFLRFLNVSLSILVVITSISVMVDGFHNSYLVMYYSAIMFLFGAAVSLIDIPSPI
ncbi:hypothetical protein [Neobacillus vireti]|uniref:hypothetical protein n=1 Tax=Neobacillus vireti TaxID=220686 RepID=UPI002FFD81E6